VKRRRAHAWLVIPAAAGALISACTGLLGIQNLVDGGSDGTVAKDAAASDRLEPGPDATQDEETGMMSTACVSDAALASPAPGICPPYNPDPSSACPSSEHCCYNPHPTLSGACTDASSEAGGPGCAGPQHELWKCYRAADCPAFAEACCVDALDGGRLHSNCFTNVCPPSTYSACESNGDCRLEGGETGECIVIGCTEFPVQVCASSLLDPCSLCR
jgi:hypothetical protein